MKEKIYLESYNNYNNNYYNNKKEIFVIYDCLCELDSCGIIKSLTDINSIYDYIKDVARIATNKKRHDILERLYFAGLIY